MNIRSWWLRFKDICTPNDQGKMYLEVSLWLTWLGTCRCGALDIPVAVCEQYNIAGSREVILFWVNWTQSNVVVVLCLTVSEEDGKGMRRNSAAVCVQEDNRPPSFPLNDSVLYQGSWAWEAGVYLMATWMLKDQLKQMNNNMLHKISLLAKSFLWFSFSPPFKSLQSVSPCKRNHVDMYEKSAPRRSLSLQVKWTAANTSGLKCSAFRIFHFLCFFTHVVLVDYNTCVVYILQPKKLWILNVLFVCVWVMGLVVEVVHCQMHFFSPRHLQNTWVVHKRQRGKTSTRADYDSSSTHPWMRWTGESIMERDCEIQVRRWENQTDFSLLFIFHAHAH